MKEYYTTKEYAKILNVHPQTLRRYTKQGLIKCKRTLGNHRRFIVDKSSNVDKPIVGYVRVSSHDQKKDLINQEEALINKAKDKGIIITKVIKDLGSGMNYKKKGFKELLKLIMTNQISKLILMPI